MGGGSIGFSGCITQGYQCYGFDFGGQSQGVTCGLDIEAAYPACAEVQRCSCQADMLYGYGYVYVCMVFAVRGAVPCLVVVAAGHDEDGCIDK